MILNNLKFKKMTIHASLSLRAQQGYQTFKRSIKLVFVCLIACQASQLNAFSPAPLSKMQPVIHFAIAQAPMQLDPRYATDAASARVNRLLYQSLIDFDAASKPVPSLARWQKVSATQYRFTLRNASQSEKAVHFHHGQLLTAEDVAATYQSILQMNDSPLQAEFSQILRIEVINHDVVDFYLSAPDEFFVSKLVIGILPAALIAQKQDFSKLPVGSGPFKMHRWQSQLALQRLHDGQIIQFVEVKDPTVRVLKLLRGEVDLLQGDLPPELVKYLSEQPEIKVKSANGANLSYIGLNFNDPVLKNPLVRQALAYAIDQDAIIKKVLVPQTRRGNTILPPEHYAGFANANPPQYRPKLARQLLKQAGINLPLKLVYKTSTDAQRVRLATIMQAQMAPAGIQLEIRSLDWGTFFDDVKQGKFQLYGLTWVGIKTPEIYAKAFGTKNIPPVGLNRGHFQDTQLDALLQQQNWAAAAKRMQSQLPIIPLWYEGQFAAMRQNLQGYSIKTDGAWDGLTQVKNVSVNKR